MQMFVQNSAKNFGHIMDNANVCPEYDPGEENIVGNSANNVWNSASFVRNRANFVRNTASFVQNSANFVRNSASFVRNSSNYVRNSASFARNSDNCLRIFEIWIFWPILAHKNLKKPKKSIFWDFRRLKIGQTIKISNSYIVFR